ncbi:MAG: abortive infection family protein [Candidatus Competibacteraceae bacterium]
MSDLTTIEKRKLERALGMGSGYVLNFSNRTFEEFFLDSFGIDIYDAKYNYGSGSKANRMRAFWELESNYLVGKVLWLLFEEWNEFKEFDSPPEPPEECLKIVRRLQESAPVPDISAVTPNMDDSTFEALARSVRECIDRNEPETGLDRLHTFLVKYFRVLCAKRGIETGREKPLHSLVGEYVRTLKSEGLIESEMTERILKSTISIMEAFNRVRNDQSFAHDNQVLNYSESLLIFGHVTSSIRFIEAIEKKSVSKSKATPDDDDDIQF